MFGRWHTLLRTQSLARQCSQFSTRYASRSLSRGAQHTSRFNCGAAQKPTFGMPRFALSGTRVLGRRGLSSGKKEGESAIKKVEAAENAVSTEVTVQQGIRNTATNTFILTLAGVALVSGYFIVSELFPSKMSPNSVFNKALKVAKDDGRLKEAIGHPIKGYGRDHGQKRTGRRNFVEHMKFKDEDDIDHTRIRFNAEGPRGKAVIYADVSAQAGSEDFYYLIVEVPHLKKKWAIHDNRPRVPKAVRQDEVATLLQQRGKAVLYGSDSCQWTKKQMLEFGEAFKRVKYVACNKDPEFCQKQGVQFLPTWEIKGKLMEPGFKTIDDLAVMATQTN